MSFDGMTPIGRSYILSCAAVATAAAGAAGVPTEGAGVDFVVPDWAYQMTYSGTPIFTIAMVAGSPVAFCGIVVKRSGTVLTPNAGTGMITVVPGETLQAYAVFASIPGTTTGLSAGERKVMFVPMYTNKEP